MIVTETIVYLLRNARPTAPGNHGRPGLSAYTALQLLRAIQRDAYRLVGLAEKDCDVGLSPRDEVCRERARARLTKHLEELCGRRVKVTFEGDPRGYVVRFWNYNDNTETQIPRYGF